MPYLGIFGVEFQKTVVIYKIRTLEFVKLYNSSNCQKRKLSRIGSKNALFGYISARVLKSYCHIWNQHAQICKTAKFCGKNKMPNFSTKNALFGYFWVRSLKNYCQVWNQHPQTCQTAKFLEKTKMSLFQTKNALFAYFWARILKAILVFETSRFKFVQLQNFVKRQKYLNLRTEMLHL